ncbi:hypothetical protein RJT34_06682 [Clitoria ternatea]|uniref:Peroxidase n=1 Tax=Clitoria ternatea TaxID=43366 RepID=A0AAN9PRV9_CLITE
MEMIRIVLVTLVVFNLVLVPSKADFGFHFPFFGGGSSPDPPQDDNQATPAGQTMANETLREDFYIDSCPDAEQIVSDALTDIFKSNPNSIANLIRLQFHDCFVVGCDASVLLDYSKAGDKVEKSSMLNGQLLKGADLIDDIKAKLEQRCPGTVSCSDTLVFATNEAMTLAGLPRRKALGGRRDSLVSLASVAERNNLPMPNWSMDQMLELFKRKGYTPEEMVVLLGAHSVGVAHCDTFMERVYDYARTGKPDAALPKKVANEMKMQCPHAGTPQFRNPPVSFDETPTVLDNLFFKNMVEKKKTLLITDSHLIADPRTFPIVKQMADDQALFQRRFVEVMDKLTSMNALIGTDGEIRKTCRSSNN